jgi:hypothetical protein
VKNRKWRPDLQVQVAGDCQQDQDQQDDDQGVHVSQLLLPGREYWNFYFPLRPKSSSRIEATRLDGIFARREAPACIECSSRFERVTR